MVPKLIAAAALLVAFAYAAAQHTRHEQQPYAGQEQRGVKALSPEEVEALLGGRGMGLAKAAELNHHPGPMHVLEHAGALGLNERQTAETKQVFERMRAEAVRLGRLILERERELDALFARGGVETAALQAATREIALLQGALRATHLGAHVEMKKILTPEQVRRYDELRGYNAPGGHDPRRHGNH